MTVGFRISLNLLTPIRLDQALAGFASYICTGHLPPVGNYTPP
jgi:hypothetical protein